jgi:hypothetical protein
MWQFKCGAVITQYSFGVLRLNVPETVLRTVSQMIVGAFPLLLKKKTGISVAEHGPTPPLPRR